MSAEDRKCGRPLHNILLMWIRKIFLEYWQKGLFNVPIKDLVHMTINIFSKVCNWIQLPLSHSFPGLDHISQGLYYFAKLQLHLKDCVTLGHLVTGDTHITIGFSYRLSPIAVGCISGGYSPVNWLSQTSRNLIIEFLDLNCGS